MLRHLLVLTLIAACHRAAPAPAAPAPAPAAAPAPLDPARKAALSAEGYAAYEAKDYPRCAALLDQVGAHYDAACCHARAGALDAGFASFERATEGPHAFRDIAHVKADPDLAALRDDPRWPQALARVEAARAAWMASINGELLEIYEADQGDRRGTYESIDWKVVTPRDHARRKRVTEIVAAGGAKAAQDWYHAAMVFQHGDTAAEIELARDYAAKAVELDPEHGSARWLVAAATDRVLMYNGEPQKYGTQYTKKDGVWILHPVAPGTTDEERIRMGVPSLADAEKRAAQMNAPTAP